MRVGVLGTADIAITSVIPAIQQSDHEVTAIASRDPERAETVASELGIPATYGSYAALVEEAEIDAVYVPLPNSLHAQWIRRSADAGRHVLCEKPLSGSATETEALFAYCSDRNVVLMEAFMYRFHPRTERASEIVREHLGAVTSVMAMCTYPVPPGADDIRLDPSLGGGSLFDVGCYGVDAIRSFLGDPDRVYASSADTRAAGVDSRMVGVMEYDSGATATVTSGFDSPDSQLYRVQTVDGWLAADRAFWLHPTESVGLEYELDGGTVSEQFDPVDDYRLEVEYFATCVEEGITPRNERDASIDTSRIVDALYRSANEGRPVDVD